MQICSAAHATSASPVLCGRRVPHDRTQGRRLVLGAHTAGGYGSFSPNAADVFALYWAHTLLVITAHSLQLLLMYLRCTGHIHTRTHTQTHTHTYTHTCTHVHTHTHIHTHIHTHTHTYTHVHTHIHIHTQTHTQTLTHRHVHTQTHMHTYTHIQYWRVFFMPIMHLHCTGHTYSWWVGFLSAC